MHFDWKFILKQYGFYVYSTGFLLLWLAFFDGANFIVQFKMWQKLQEYRAQIVYYDDELKKLKLKERNVLNNQDELEKFGREKFLMKKEGETVFVIVNKEGRLMEDIEE